MVDWIARGRDQGHLFLMINEILAFRRVIPGSMTFGRGEADRGYLDVVRRALERKRAVAGAPKE
jgi:hypothetical protein